MPIMLSLLPKYKPVILRGTISDISDAQTGEVIEPITVYRQKNVINIGICSISGTKGTTSMGTTIKA